MSHRTIGNVATTVKLLLHLLLLQQGHGMIASPDPFEVEQSNGQVIKLQLHGDPYDNYLTDLDGYTVLKGSNGSFVYAQPNPTTGALDPSIELVTEDHHRHHDDDDTNDDRRRLLLNTPRHLRPTKRDCRDMICEERQQQPPQQYHGLLRGKGQSSSFHPTTHENDFFLVNALNLTMTNGSGDSNSGGGDHPQRHLRTRGTLRNLVILLRFANHENRTLPSPQDVDILMNHGGPHDLCPTGSVRDVFLENSYGALQIESTVTDWIPLNETEAYYSNGVSGRSKRIWEAIYSALEYLDANRLVDFNYFDQDQSGRIDSITFLHSGFGAEWGGTDQDGVFYDYRLWSHKWSLFEAPFVSSSGVEVLEYHLSPSLWGRSGDRIGRIGVIAHETGHFLGIPGKK
jgi:hypothetical protein